MNRHIKNHKTQGNLVKSPPRTKEKTLEKAKKLKAEQDRLIKEAFSSALLGEAEGGVQLIEIGIDRRRDQK